jgi:hypothetical protein
MAVDDRKSDNHEDSPGAVATATGNFVEVGKVIDRGSRQIKVISIDSEVNSKVATSLLKADNVQAGRPIKLGAFSSPMREPGTRAMVGTAKRAP